MNIFCDWKTNKGNPKAKLILLSFRISNIAKTSRALFYLLLPQLLLHRICIEWILGVEIPWKTTIGKELTIYHGQSLVINDSTIIGERCILRHCTTIGNKQLSDGSFSGSPIIGDNVDIGANVCIIGEVTIGDNVQIGAGTIVIKDVPSNSVIVGNPGKIIKTF